MSSVEERETRMTSPESVAGCCLEGKEDEVRWDINYMKFCPVWQNVLVSGHISYQTNISFSDTIFECFIIFIVNDMKFLPKTQIVY